MVSSGVTSLPQGAVMGFMSPRAKRLSRPFEAKRDLKMLRLQPMWNFNMPMSDIVRSIVRRLKLNANAA